MNQSATMITASPIAIAGLNPCHDLYPDENDINLLRSLPPIFQESFPSEFATKVFPGGSAYNVQRILNSLLNTKEGISPQTRFVSFRAQQQSDQPTFLNQAWEFFIEQDLTGAHHNNTLIPVGGDIRYNLYDEDLKKDPSHIGINLTTQQIDNYISALDGMLESGQVLYMDRPPKVFLKIYDKIQRLAQQKGIRLFADARGEQLKRILNNTHDFGKLSGLKLNLKEFCDYLQIQGSVYENLLKGNLTDIFESNLLPKVLEFTKKYIREDGVFVLSCGGYPCYFVKGTGEILKVIQPKVKAVSTVGCGDSIMAQLLYNVSHGIELDEQQAIRMVASGLATALQPGTGLATPQTIEEALAREGWEVKEISGYEKAA